MKRVLLTGGSGFIGRNLGPALAAEYDVLAPSHSELELTDEDAVRAWLTANPVDAVVHSAVKPAHRNAGDRERILLDNTRMFFAFARCRDLFGKMVFLGSGAVYDERHYAPRMPETYFDAHVPVDEHGLAKYVAAKYMEAVPGFTELRVFGVFGPWEDHAIRFISNAACKALCGMPITLRQDRRFDYLWIRDLAPVVRHFIENDGAHTAYNVTPDRTVHLRALADLVLEATGSDVPVLVAAEGLGVEYSGDNSRLRAEMPRLAFTPVEDAVRELVAWYRDRVGEPGFDRECLRSDR